MLVIVGEGGTGKTTAAKVLCNEYGYEMVVPYTTRPPRENEVPAIDYYFVNNSSFNAMITNGTDLGEWSNYNSWYYGTIKKDYIGDKKVLVTTPSGLRKIKKNCPDVKVISFYLTVPRRSILIQMLQRGDNIEEAYRRSLTDVGQFDGVGAEVDYIISNNNFRRTPGEIAEMIISLANFDPQ